MSRVRLYTSRKVRVPAGRLSLVATVAVGLLSAVTQTAAAAPAAPSTVSVSPASPTTATAITVSWATQPDVAATHWQICPAADAQSAACRTGEVASPAQQGSIPTPDEGVFGVSLWFEGTDGFEGPKAAAGEQVIVDRTAPEQPVDVRYDGRTVSWQAPAGQVAPISRVHWKLCRGRNNPADDACASGTATGETFALPESTVPLGPDETSCDQVNSIVSIYLEDAAGNVSPANVISGGYSVAPGCIAPPTPPVAVPTPAPAKRKAVRLTVNARWGKTSSTGGRKATLAVATAKGGASTGRVRVRVTGTLKGRSYARTRTVTLKRGAAAFKLTVPKGVRRLKATARYGGSKDFMPASKTRAFRVPTS